MATYSFELDDSEPTKDATAVELPSLSAAHDEAVRYLASVLLEGPERIRWDNRKIRVRDKEDRVLFEVGVYSVPYPDTRAGL